MDEYFEYFVFVLSLVMAVIFAVLEWRTFVNQKEKLDDHDDDIREMQQRIIIAEMSVKHLDERLSDLIRQLSRSNDGDGDDDKDDE